MSRVSFSVMRPLSLCTIWSLRAQDPHMVELLPGEGIRGHDVQRIALHRADEGQRDAGAAAGVFDDGAARRQAPVRLRRFDHGERHAVLHAAGGILVFQLQQDAGAVPGHDVAQGHQRGVADAVQDVSRQFGHRGPWRLSRYLHTMYIHISMSTTRQPRKTLRTRCPRAGRGLRRLEQPARRAAHHPVPRSRARRRLASPWRSSG